MDTALAHRNRRTAALAVVLGVLALHACLLGRWTMQASHGGRQTPPPSAHAARSSWVLTVPAKVVPPEAPPVPNDVGAGPREKLRARLPVEPTHAAPAATAAPTEPREAAVAAMADAEGEPPITSTDGAMPSQAPPVYATRPPDPARLRYALRIGIGPSTRSGEATLAWQHDGERYRLSLTGDDTGTPLLTQTSIGAFDAAGLAPERHTDQRRSRRVRTATFQRESGRISFSGARIEHPIWPGAQDRLGWIVQLAAIAQAAGRVPPEVSLFVVDGRGAGGLWTFTAQGAETINSPLGPIAAMRVLREPQALYDWRVEAWLDPARGFWPARLRMSLPRSGAVFELSLLAEPAPP